MKKIQFLFSVFAFAALAFAGCSDDDTNDVNGAQTAVTKLALADAAQAELTFAASEPEAQIVILDTDAAVEDITVVQVLAEGESKAEWCEVEKLSATQIKVAPASNFDTEARSIKFRISAGELAPVEFTVTQQGADEEPEPVENTLSVSLEDQYGMYFFTAPAAGGEITVATVNTNAAEWTAEFDEGYGETPYCSLKTVSGADGDALIVVFEPNTSDQMKSGATVTISAGNAEPIEIYLNQEAPEATEILVADADSGEDCESPCQVLFGKDEFGYDKMKEFEVVADGSYEVKIVAEGIDTEVEADWLEAFGGFGSVTITALSANETTEDRKLDVILVGKDNAELFRFKVSQTGTAEVDEELND